MPPGGVDEDAIVVEVADGAARSVVDLQGVVAPAYHPIPDRE
jgi:hypothetical protein